MKTIAPGVIVIGKYNPRVPDASRISEKLFEISEKHNLRAHNPSSSSVGVSGESDRWHFYDRDAELRFPIATLNIKQRDSMVNNWHHDRPSSRELNIGIVLWSNREQTEILLQDGTVVVPNPGEVVLVKNEAVQHKTPTNVSPDRWFFRQFVFCPEWL